MDKSTTSCPFCLQSFVKLGNHLKNCPKRDGRSYDYLLSKKTLDKRTRKTKAECPSCRKSFLRLDTHLRNSTACKHYISQTSDCSITSNHTSQTENTLAMQNSDPPHIDITNQKTTNKPIMKRLLLPSSKEEWFKADTFFKNNVVSQVCNQMSVERMNEVLCKNVYAFFASKYGTKCHTNQHQSKQSSHQRVLKKVRGEKQEVKRQLRQLRKYGNEEDIRKLVHEFHTLVKRLSSLQGRQET